MEKTIVYELNLVRNKFGEYSGSVNKLKKELYKGVCNTCNKEFKLSNLQLEHNIPVRIGGNIIDSSNLSLICNRCHNKKTKTDILIINTLKRLYFIKDQYSLVEISELHKQYNYFKKIIEKNKEVYDNFTSWDTSSSRDDYSIYLYKDNREPIKKGEEDGRSSN